MEICSFFDDPSKVIFFIREVAGCQCPIEVISQAKVEFNSRPLLNLFLNTFNRLKYSPRLTEIEKQTNIFLGLPADLMWPRNKKGHLRHPKSWTKKCLSKHYPEAYIEPLCLLRKLVFVSYEVLIDVPKRAFFLIKASQSPLSDTKIERAYLCGQLLTKLEGYNRFRLITITTPPQASSLNKIDKALSWAEIGEKFEHLG